jgi:membrane peptidoglycan carboxypeptidase
MRIIANTIKRGKVETFKPEEGQLNPMESNINNHSNNHQNNEIITVPNRENQTHTNGHVQTTTPPALTPIIPTAPAQTVKPSSSTSIAARNATTLRKVNRMIIRRHLHERYSRSYGPRILAASLIFVIALFAVLSTGVGAAYAFYQQQLPLLNGIADHSLFQSTHIYDRNGHLLYELYDHQNGHGRRTYVNYTQISPLLINASIAAEDHSFWVNNGVDVQGTLRAAVTNLQSHSVVEGGSTITQQLVKNQLFLSQPRSLQIKGEEAILSYGLTKQYPKWKIMEMYLNTVYYGDLNYGIEAAAQDFFNIHPQCSRRLCKPAASQLDLAQASLLAGLPQSPSYYNPVYNKSVALDRQQTVLGSMVALKMITEEQAQQAEAETAKFHFKSYASNQGIQAPHFVRYVIDQVLVPLVGAQNLYNGGYNIYTTLDLNLEKKVEQIAYGHLYKPLYDPYLGSYGPLNIQNNVNNAAVVVMNPYNGEILAMDGSADYNNKSPQVRGQYNSAIALRQPGSSFKPVEYAAAFEMGWYPGMIIPDHKTTYPSQLSGNPPAYYTPQNYDQKFHTGFPMTARNAIANSFNIPAIDTLEYAGIPNVLNMAGRLGLTEVANRSPSSFGPSMALGTSEVSLLHLTSAYATFANQGVRVPPTSILEITDNQGYPLYSYNSAHPQGVHALRADVAFLISSILSDTKSRYHEFGPGNPLELDRPAAAKTGTTQSFRDNWTIGYTPYVTVGVWAGNSDNTTMNNIIGITGAGPIWHDVMEYVSHQYNYPPDDFSKPSDVHAMAVSAYTGLAPHSGEPTVTDWFIDGTQPTIQGTFTNPSPCNGDNGDNCKPHHCKKNCDVPPTN